MPDKVPLKTSVIRSRPMTRNLKKAVRPDDEDDHRPITASDSQDTSNSDDSTPTATTASSDNEDTDSNRHQTRDPLLLKKPTRFIEDYYPYEWTEVKRKKTKSCKNIINEAVNVLPSITGRKCSRCHQVGHYMNTCRTIFSSEQPTQRNISQQSNPEGPRSNLIPLADFSKSKPVRWLDKSIRQSFRDVANALIRTIIENEVERHNAVICFLYFPNVIARSRHRSTTKAIMDQWAASRNVTESIMEYRNRDLATLKGNSTYKGNSNGTKTIARAKNAIKTGNLRRAIQILEEGPAVMSLDDEVIKKIQNLHPEPICGLLETTVEESIYFDEDAIGLAIERLPKSRSTGLSSWSNEILKIAWQSPSISNNPDEETIAFRENIKNLINAIANGKAGNSDFWVNSLIIPLSNDGVKIRPIAVDNIFLRLVGKLILQSRSSDIGKSLLPFQKAIGIQSGNEQIIHETHSWVTKMSTGLNTDSIAQLDLSNAFGSIDRNAILEALSKIAPEIVPYFKWTYGTSSRLYSADGRHVATSKTGVRQGDPLGPLFFCLGIQKILEQCQLNFPDIRLVAYMDDITLFGDHRYINDAIQWLTDAFKNIQLKLNPEKTTIYGHSINST